MSSTQNSVPRLDLAPKLYRSLSLKNPLDYLRVFYWFFFFPQALRLFEGKIYKLIVIGLIIVSILIFFINFVFIYIFNADLRLVELLIGALFFGFTIGTIGFWNNSQFHKKKKLLLSLVSGLSFTFSWLILVIPSYYILNFVLLVIPDLPLIIKKIDSELYYSIFIGIWFGASVGLLSNINSGLVLNVNKKWINDSLIGIKLYVFSLIFEFFVDSSSINKTSLIRGVITILFWTLASSIVIPRLLEWIISSIFNLSSRSNNIKGILFIRVTPLPILNLSKKVKKWLLQDWETGLHNANQFLEYTLQYKSVVQGISYALSELPQEHIIFRTSQLTNYPYDWTVIQLIFKKLNQLAEQNNANKNSLIQITFNNYLVASNATKGFWYLHESAVVGDNGISLEINFIEESVKAFTQIRSLPYGEELYMLAQTLAAFANAGELAVVSLLRLPAIPQEPILRTSTWEVINSLHQVVQAFSEIQSKVSRAVRLSALKRALIELDQVKNKVDLLPEAERFLIKYIVITWQDSLERVNTQLEKFLINSPIKNPYIIGDPVQGQSFVGRKDILERLEQVWVFNKQLQSIVLYGHRRMGKTSILRNISTRLDEKVKLAYVNLLTVGNSIQGVGEVLMAISDSLSDTLQIPPPDDDSLINLPYRTFERYLKQIETQLGDTGLIIALDEFEQIEELIKTDRIPKDFMGVLRGMVQMSPKIAFALAGLHTLEEMTEDYFNPFFASIIPIRVSFLERVTCRYLLANPSEDFPLDYKPDALDYIYDLTAGQPYLVQLIGFLLVRRYNDQVFELGNNRDPMFTITDVDGIINQPEFYQNGRYYFTGVWQQAGEGSPGQQNIIKAIAPHRTGLDFNTLKTVTNLDSNSLQNALDTLSRHDVIQETDNHWKIIVELFRRWVINN